MHDPDPPCCAVTFGLTRRAAATRQGGDFYRVSPLSLDLAVLMTSPPEFQPKRLMTRRLSIIFQIAALGTVAMCASAPTPLYRVYQQHWEFSPVMVTIVFSAYAISLLLALLTVGGLSDYIGRRPMIFSGLAISALALVMFIAADSVAMLIAARTIQGFAVGIAFGAIGAAMLDTDRAHGSLMNSVTPVTGTAIGTLFSGLLVTYAPMPTQLIYVVLLIASVLLAALVWWMPETGVKRPGALASLRPVVRVPHHARPALILVSPGIVALWALCGFYLSLMPGLLQLETGSNSPLLGGFAVSLLTFSGAAAMLLARHHDPDPQHVGPDRRRLHYPRRHLHPKHSAAADRHRGRRLRLRRWLLRQRPSRSAAGAAARTCRPAVGYPDRRLPRLQPANHRRRTVRATARPAADAVYLRRSRHRAGGDLADRRRTIGPTRGVTAATSCCPA